MCRKGAAPSSGLPAAGAASWYCAPRTPLGVPCREGGPGSSPGSWHWAGFGPGAAEPGEGAGSSLTCPSARCIEQLEDLESLFAGDDPSASTPRYQVRDAGSHRVRSRPSKGTEPFFACYGGDRPPWDCPLLSIQEAKQVKTRGPDVGPPALALTDSLVSRAAGPATLGGPCRGDGLSAGQHQPGTRRAWGRVGLGRVLHPWHPWHRDGCPWADLSCVIPGPEGGGARAAPDPANHHRPTDPISKQRPAPGVGDEWPSHGGAGRGARGTPPCLASTAGGSHPPGKGGAETLVPGHARVSPLPCLLSPAPPGCPERAPRRRHERDPGCRLAVLPAVPGGSALRHFPGVPVSLHPGPGLHRQEDGQDPPHRQPEGRYPRPPWGLPVAKPSGPW